MLKGKNIDELYIALSKRLLKNGEVVLPRGMKTYELLDTNLILTDPTKSFLTLRSRNLSLSYANGELVWYYTGNNKLSYMQHYSKKMKEFSDDGVTLSGAYGPKIKKSLPKILKLFKKDPYTRRAVISLFDNNQNYLNSKDVPCTITLHFLIRNNKLDLFVNMRSNDFYLGLPYDIYSFSMLQVLVALELGLMPGNYHHHVDSLHFYERDKSKVLKISNDHILENNSKQWKQDDFIKNIDFMVDVESKIREGKNFSIPESIRKSSYCIEVIKSWENRAS
ncbi:hypothetical protein ERK19_05060 [Lactobacillus helsingborgensis]|uniref:thymidylate synthase n=1 Tax=Lactobacillus helsingborgensis TaxID=1218494 RepID=UPI0016505AA6|nr:thymidylate synthase [Lactobacillus helsingborgensis]MBC6356719.1 hypothetical protein [Lactobacillus helsingborgensis]